MSLAKKTVLGAIWTIATSLGARALGLIGTLLLTRWLAPDVYGEVSVASVVALTASTVSNLALAQYLVANPDAGRAAAFHATVVHVVLGAAALGVATLLRAPLGGLFDAPAMGRFLPGLALAAFLDRITYVPEKLMVRDLRFREVGLQQSAGELVYTACSVGLAYRGLGGDAVVIATLARSVLRLLLVLRSVPAGEWLAPHRLARGELSKLLQFGVPLSIASLAAFGARRWDNLLFSAMFGPETAGVYNLAYNLADIPATQIGERIGDVLVPSFAKIPDAEKRRAALVRAQALLLLVVTPLALGLGAVAPAVVAALFKPAWAPVAPMLAVLSALSVARPVGWIVESYLQADKRTRAVMLLEIGKTVGLLAAIAVLGRSGPLVACGAVGVAFGAHAAACLWVLRASDGVPWSRTLSAFVGPLLASLPMVGAVLGTGALLERAGLGGPLVALLAEVSAGAVGYGVGVALFARAAARDLVGLVRGALGRRKRPPA